jgi:hypothetical protein
MQSMDSIRLINALANTRRLAIDCDGYCALIRAEMCALMGGGGVVSLYSRRFSGVAFRDAGLGTEQWAATSPGAGRLP